jgi:hypothetical protein
MNLPLYAYRALFSCCTVAQGFRPHEFGTTVFAAHSLQQAMRERAANKGSTKRALSDESALFEAS